MVSESLRVKKRAQEQSAWEHVTIEGKGRLITYLSHPEYHIRWIRPK